MLVLDLNLPDGNGWTLLEQLHSLHALPPTLVLSVCDEEVYARRILRAGAMGYLMKEEPIERVLNAIRQIHAGHLVASAAITSRLMADALNISADPDERETLQGAKQLSDRELQLFALLGEGLRNKEAAARLGLSEKTVATYKVRLMEKLGVRTTPELMSRFQTWRK